MYPSNWILLSSTDMDESKYFSDILMISCLEIKLHASICESLDILWEIKLLSFQWQHEKLFNLIFLGPGLASASPFWGRINCKIEEKNRAIIPRKKKKRLFASPYKLIYEMQRASIINKHFDSKRVKNVEKKVMKKE